MNIKEKDSKYIANTYARFPIQIVSGKGSVVYDENGKEYIDLGAGIAVNIFGLADKSWIEAVNAQMCKLQHMSNLYYTEPCANLAEMLCKKTGMKNVFFANSGAEANECAIKAARKYAAEKKGKDYYTIITLKNSFHGRTITTLAATGQEEYHNDFTPLTPGFVYAEPDNIESVKTLVKENRVAAIMFEVIQGEGGVIPLQHKFIQGIAEIAEKEDILMIVDEVQTGNGRTGELYAYMNHNINPDIISTAKGIGGGLPIGVTMFGEKVANVYKPGMHGSTFGGNPIACAGAINILSRIDTELLKSVKEKSAYIFNELNGSAGINKVSGIGLMIGIETVKDASEVIAECMNNGVLVLKAHNNVRLVPALNIPVEQLKKAVEIIKNVCAG